MNKKFLLALIGLATAWGASAQVYKTTGPGGKLKYTDVPPPTAAPRNELLRPEVIGAVANVIGVAHLVSRTRAFCIAEFPSSYSRYSSAAQGWTKRNAGVIAQKERVMASEDRRLVASALNGDMVIKTEEMMRSIKAASAAEKNRWCDKTFNDVNSGMLDLAGRPSIIPLMRYVAR